MINIFRCERLDKLNKEGKFKSMLANLNHQINSKTWLGAGSEAAAFYYNNQVVKVCPKKIRYFKEAKHLSGKLFRHQVNKLSPFLVPVNKVLYEDDHVLVYTQDRCQMIKDINYKSPYIVISFLQLIIFMFERNELVSDIGTHNLGLLNGHLVVFDYHGLHPIIRNGLVRHKKWWKRPVINLSNFVSYIDNKGDKFSAQYNTFLSALTECKTEKDLSKLIRLLYKCLNILIKSVHLSDDQVKIIKVRQNLLDKGSSK